MRVIRSSAFLYVLLTAQVVSSHALWGATPTGPFVNGKFQGRIAYSADGNNRDRDDLFASAVTIAMFKAFGVTDKVVHLDYNSILGEDDPEYLKVHEASVRGAAKRFGLPDNVIFNDSRELDAAIDSIRDAVNASSENDPLYFVIAGPMEVPWRGINAAQPDKRKHVYCISHTVWNDLFFWDTGNRELTHHRRDLIDLGINWVQILNQQGLGTCPEPKNGPCPQEKWALWDWMRDSRHADVAWLYERLEAMGRPDCSDSGMVYFLLTGNEKAIVQNLNDLLHGRVPRPLAQRPSIRLEAENFQFDNYTSPSRRMGSAVSQRMAAQLLPKKFKGSMRTLFGQPYATSGQYDIEVRYMAAAEGSCQFALFVNGVQQGESWTDSSHSNTWQTQTITNVKIHSGDEIKITASAEGKHTGGLDYVQFNRRLVASATSRVEPPPSGPATMFAFRHHYIDRDLPGASYGQTSLVDIDKDGDLDFVTGGKGPDLSIFWFEFQGPDAWVRHVLGTHHPSDVGGTAIDVDGDGWLDHVTGGVWYRNTGRPRSEAFQRIVFDSELAAVHDLVPADLDGDGRLEVITMSDKNNLRWYRIPKNSHEPWERHDAAVGVHAGVAVGDIDGDGDLDIARSNAWFENQNGKGLKWIEHAIPFGNAKPPYPLATRCRIVDINQDGHNDLVMTENEIRAGRIAWFNNEGGKGLDWVIHELPAGDSAPRGAYHSLAVADFDQDGDQDIFTVEMEAIPGARLPRWFIWENVDGRGANFQERVILDNGLGGHEAVVADVDGDGDFDICSKLWRPRKDNANGGRNHADFIENLLTPTRRR